MAPRRSDSIIYPHELGRLLYPHINDKAPAKRVCRGASSGAIPGLVRLNRRRLAFSREAVEVWLAGRNGDREKP